MLSSLGRTFCGKGITYGPIGGAAYQPPSGQKDESKPYPKKSRSLNLFLHGCPRLQFVTFPISTNS
jgi:hypothetical protein